MRQISVKNLKEGDIVAKHIFSSNGYTLIGKDVKLTSKAIDRLNNMGINLIYIKDDKYSDIVIEDVISEKTRLKTLKTMKDTIDALMKNKDFDGYAIRECAEYIYEDIRYNDDNTINLLNISSKEDALYFHPVNVAVLAAIIGKKSKQFNQKEMEELIVGALLHDIGLVSLPKEILYKLDKLNKDEEKIYKEHPMNGFNIIRKHRELSVKSAAVALQHHENSDGSGFPQNFTRDKILHFAKIVSVADIYDKLITGQIGGRQMLPHEAYEILMGLTNKYLDKGFVEIFLRNIAIYPNGVTVKLNNNKIGVVMKQNLSLPQRPIIRVFDDNGCDFKDFNLLEHNTIFINQVIL